MIKVKIKQLGNSILRRKPIAKELARERTSDGITELIRMAERRAYFSKNIFGVETINHYTKRDQDIALEVLGETGSRIARDYFRSILKWEDEIIEDDDNFSEGESYWEETVHHYTHKVNYPNACKSLRKRLGFLYDSWSNKQVGLKDTRNKKLHRVIYGASSKLESSVQ